MDNYGPPTCEELIKYRSFRDAQEDSSQEEKGDILLFFQLRPCYCGIESMMFLIKP